ncbi:hypothetical protein PMAYCL1PPCAC_03154 [Pristionchus mayeri]|uniref:C2H2-type domain-containing protein n=1 Tax=Pristionchus mayeri TaxID=1317129 RepID=A0AAN5C8N0_9BILA|nr:hypothetical protein PMAYCL1PPCAC_03154 [Pristionchus mayeri]
MKIMFRINVTSVEGSSPSLILRRHAKIHLPLDDPRRMGVKCEVCGRFVAGAHSLKIHKMRHMEGEENQKPFQCDLCEGRFRSIGQVNQHKRSRHKDEQVAKKHSNRHSSKPTNYHCEICGKYFAILKSFHNHRRTIHNVFIRKIRTRILTNGTEETDTVEDPVQGEEQTTSNLGLDERALIQM